jgi:methylmalonyl-CoA mutase, C-terminal domain
VLREHVRTSFSRAPDDDRPALRDAGVAEVFTPGASTHDIVAWVRDHLGPHVS